MGVAAGPLKRRKKRKAGNYASSFQLKSGSTCFTGPVFLFAQKWIVWYNIITHKSTNPFTNNTNTKLKNFVSFPRKRESVFWLNTDPRFRGDDEKNSFLIFVDLLRDLLICGLANDTR